VLSTRSAPPLTIAFRRADVRAFWILSTAACSLALGGGAWLLGAAAPRIWAAGGLAVLLPGLVRPEWFNLGIRAWNKGVRISRAALRAYVLKVVYYLLFAPLGWGGSALELRLGQSEISRWISRAGHKKSFGDCDRLPGAGGWWGHELLMSARSLNTAWQICLMPAVLLLLLLRDETAENTVPSNTYTLY
jgi:hypothetical protein